ncbi:MAG: hypothetical protein DU480_13690 [Nitrosomonas sp.]|uniref:baseplate J/gp47 family protein n=1 Tax=Nitrosomonas sp. TaxID=42353 RepID=UPI0032EF2CAF
MPLQSPNLDDRAFAELMEEAKLRIRQNCSNWNDLSPSDPGIVLLEAFAFLTETMIFRFNRIPEKAYIEFLNIIGVKLMPPSAAQVKLEFFINKPLEHDIKIPIKTRVTTAGNSSGSSSNSPIFVLTESALIPAGKTNVTALAYHCNQVEAELIGYGTGLPGQTLTVKYLPVISPTADKLDLIVGIETQPDELEIHEAAMKYNDKTYRVWREVENFSQSNGTQFIYITDRQAGTITFSPSIRRLDSSGQLEAIPHTLGEVPPNGREIRVWYRYGGGSQGNMPAQTLTVLKDPIAGVSVNNPEPATGGRDGESLQNALIRGPRELHSLSRAVTARDFELIAIQSSGAVNRAKAFTQAKLWVHAIPGTVEVTLVPEINVKPDELQKISFETLKAHHLDVILDQIQSTLESRKPLGINCIVNWASYKKVTIKAKVTIYREEDIDQVKQRVLAELYRSVCPINLSFTTKTPWSFGQSIKAWDVYKIISSEPAVISVDSMQMAVDHAPEAKIADICSDSFQPNTWYAGCDERIFRSTNNGNSWELIACFKEEKIERVKSFPIEACSGVNHPGLVAAITQSAGNNSIIYITRDCGQTWIIAQQLQYQVEDFAWLDRDGFPYLLLATEKGVFELGLDENDIPNPIIVDAKLPEIGFRSIVVSASSAGKTFVAVASYESKGIYLSFDGGKSMSYKNIGLAGELIEMLSVQHKGSLRYIWAGVGAPGSDPGKGCFRWTLSDSTINPEGWKGYSKNWKAGGCRSLAFYGSTVLAASYRFGVLRLNSDLLDAEWETLNASECGLPIRDVGKLETIDALAANENSKMIMAGGVLGVYSSSDVGLHYSKCSYREFTDEISIPPNWLLYSGDHQIEIIAQNETSRD